MTDRPTRGSAVSEPHPDDELHPPTSDDPYWTETCWFTFAVPELKLSGQLYPFFRQNQNIVAGGAYFWDDQGDGFFDVLYAKNFWHLPMPDQPLSDITLPNGISYRCLEPLMKYAISYRDPDSDDVAVDLTFTGVTPPHRLGKHHLDQPGRYQGTITLYGEEHEVDAYGFRDRSWGLRSQFGPTMVYRGTAHGGYDYATASPDDGFHMITWDRGSGCEALHGHYMRHGQWAELREGRRTVLERDPGTGCPTRVEVTGVDELGRDLHAVGVMHNRIGVPLNPNMLTWNCLTEWTFDGITAWGEDHDNWSARGARAFFREQLGYRRLPGPLPEAH